MLFMRVVRLIVVSNESRLQHLVGDHNRATAGSIYSFISRIFSALIISMIGFTAVSDNILTPMRWTILFIVCGYVVLQLRLLRNQPKN